MKASSSGSYLAVCSGEGLPQTRYQGHILPHPLRLPTSLDDYAKLHGLLPRGQEHIFSPHFSPVSPDSILGKGDLPCDLRTAAEIGLHLIIIRPIRTGMAEQTFALANEAHVDNILTALLAYDASTMLAEDGM